MSHTFLDKNPAFNGGVTPLPIRGSLFSPIFPSRVAAYFRSTIIIFPDGTLRSSILLMSITRYRHTLLLYRSFSYRTSPLLPCLSQFLLCDSVGLEAEMYPTRRQVIDSPFRDMKTSLAVGQRTQTPMSLPLSTTSSTELSHFLELSEDMTFFPLLTISQTCNGYCLVWLPFSDLLCFYDLLILFIRNFLKPSGSK